MNEFVPVSELMQSRKDKINFEDITEIFLFSLFDLSIMTQIVERVCTVKLYFKGIILNFSYNLSLKVNWVYSLQYLFYHLLYMVRAVSRI